MKIKITMLAIMAVSCFYGCKKTQSAQVKETMQIVVKGIPTGGYFNINVSDYTNAKNPSDVPAPFFTVSNVTTEQTYNVDVYSGEQVSFNDAFSGNYSNISGGTIATVSVKGTILLTTAHGEGSGAHFFSIP